MEKKLVITVTSEGNKLNVDYENEGFSRMEVLGILTTEQSRFIELSKKE